MNRVQSQNVGNVIITIMHFYIMNQTINKEKKKKGVCFIQFKEIYVPSNIHYASQTKIVINESQPKYSQTPVPQKN